MFYNHSLLMAIGDQPVFMPLQMANRHGLITGATGTGKTVTVKVMAEAFSDAGVPVFLSDIKGDLAGMSMVGVNSDSIQQRLNTMGLAEIGWDYKAFPTVYWDVFARKGIPVRATVSEMGPLLLSRLMDLTPAQEGVLNIIFRIADDQGLLLLDLKDLRSVVQAVGDHASAYKTVYGNIAGASIGAIQRGLLKLENQEGGLFFGEPALQIMDWIRCDQNGKGVINVLHCEELFQRPDLYTAYLLWMLSELYEALPEVGDLDKPRMVFFFDEAHLLFKLKSKELLEKVDQVIRLIRSKGVGVYFITQNPADVPDTILSQLNNKIQHALRAYTPAEQKEVRAAARSFVPNPNFSTEEVISQLGKGEALISFLDEKGIPSMVQRATILPPQSMMGTIDDNLRTSLILSSDMYAKYTQTVDRYSAYEMLMGLAPQAQTLQSVPSFSFAGTEPSGPSLSLDGSWQCPVCGASNTGNFCSNCGSAKPEAAPAPSVQGGWVCSNCGTANTGNFCSNCGMGQAASSLQTGAFQQPVSPAPAPSFAQAAANVQTSFATSAANPQPQANAYNGPSLVQAVMAQQAAQTAQTQTYTQAQLEKMQKEAVRQAKAELKAEQAANKESDLAKSAKSIATSGARTAVNYLVRGALGTLLKK